MVKRVVLLGAGGHARVIWDTLQLARERDQFQIVTVLDDNPGSWGHSFMGIPIQGPLGSLTDIQADAAIIGIGENRARGRVYELVTRINVPLINALHPTAVIARDVQLGQGIVAFANVVVNIGTRIEDNVILNTACTVDHDCLIGAHAHLAPGVHLAGSVRVGQGALVGIGSSVLPGLAIGAWVTVGAGSVVIRDIGPEVTVAGVPARNIKSKSA